MTRDELSAKVRRLVTDYFEEADGRVQEDAGFTADLGADSLDFMEVVMMFEEEFDIEIHDDDAESVKTVGAAVDLIQRLLADG
jgi:acyl carrier protein